MARRGTGGVRRSRRGGVREREGDGVGRGGPGAEAQAGGAKHGGDPGVAGAQDVEPAMGGEEPVGRAKAGGGERDRRAGLVAAEAAGDGGEELGVLPGGEGQGGQVEPRAQGAGHVNPQNGGIAGEASPDGGGGEVGIAAGGGVELPRAPADDQPLGAGRVQRQAVAGQGGKGGAGFGREGEEEVIVDRAGDEADGDGRAGGLRRVLQRAGDQRAGDGGQQVGGDEGHEGKEGVADQAHGAAADAAGDAAFGGAAPRDETLQVSTLPPGGFGPRRRMARITPFPGQVDWLPRARETGLHLGRPSAFQPVTRDH